MNDCRILISKFDLVGDVTIKGLGEAMMITWAWYGLRIEKENESVNSLEIYISVPERSYHLDVHNEEMAGIYLARRFKTALLDMGVKRLTVKSRVRKGEQWTETMAKDAEKQMKQAIYGSQW